MTDTEQEVEWRISCSKTETHGSRIACESWEVVVVAASEEEARACVAEHEPDADIDAIEQLT